MFFRWLRYFSMFAAICLMVMFLISFIHTVYRVIFEDAVLHGRENQFYIIFFMLIAMLIIFISIMPLIRYSNRLTNEYLCKNVKSTITRKKENNPDD